MFNTTDDKIIQIIPAPEGMVSVRTINEIDYEFPIVCLGLTVDGQVLPMEMDVTGYVESIHEATSPVRMKLQGEVWV